MVLKVLAPRSNLFALFFLAVLLLVGFGNTLTNYFHCDDFLHTAYLYRVFNGEPGLIWQNFCSCWLQDRSFYTFFRPLTELSLASDYFLYQANAVGYHFTNLVLHFANACLVFFIAGELLNSYTGLQKREMFLPAFLSAAFFLVLPTHTEAVSWILARSDLAATFFYLTTIFLFFSNSRAARTLSLATLTLALLSKEMSVSLPIVLIVLAREKSLKRRLALCLPHLAILFVYFGWRSLSLGTVYGGYTGSLGERMRNGLFERWFSSEALYQIFLPFNDLLIDKSNPIRLVTRGLYLSFAAMLVLNLKFDDIAKKKASLVLALSSWTLLTLLPSIEILGVTDHMSGGRILYLPAVPICIGLACSVFCLRPNHEKGSVIVRGLTIVVMLVAVMTATLVVRINNKSWSMAGEVVSTLRSEIIRESMTLREGEQLAVFNIPGQALGAYTFTIEKTFKGFISKPFCKDLNHSVFALDFHPFWSDWINYQDLLALQSNSTKYRLRYFDQNSRSLKILNSPRSEHSVAPQQLTLAFEKLDDLKENKEFYFGLNPKVKTGELQILEINWQDQSPAIFISWNDKGNNFDKESLFIKGSNNGKIRTDYLPLCNYKSWLITHPEISTIRVLAAGLNQSAPSLKLLPEIEISPIIKTTAPVLPSIKELSSSNKILSILFDASKIAGAKTVRFELTKQFKYFNHYSSHPRDAQALPDPLKTWNIENLKGSLTLDREILPEKGFYQIRLGAYDENKKQIGIFSEAITIANQ